MHGRSVAPAVLPNIRSPSARGLLGSLPGPWERTCRPRGPGGWPGNRGEPRAGPWRPLPGEGEAEVPADPGGSALERSLDFRRLFFVTGLLARREVAGTWRRRVAFPVLWRLLATPSVYHFSSLFSQRKEHGPENAPLCLSNQMND